MEINSFNKRFRRGKNRVNVHGSNYGRNMRVKNIKVRTSTTFNDVLQTTRQSRDGIQMKVTPVETSEVIGEKLVSRDIVPFMRKRNIEIVTSRMKPKTQFYVYFDDVDVTQFTTPKLIEIRLSSYLGDGLVGLGAVVSAIYFLSGGMQLVGGWLSDKFDLKSVYLLCWMCQVQ